MVYCAGSVITHLGCWERRIQWNLDITNLYIKKSCLSFGISGAQVISEELTILSKFSHKAGSELKCQSAS